MPFFSLLETSSGHSDFMATAPLIVHVIYRLDFGGLENGLVNLINNMSEDKYRHAIICATDYTEFRKRITRRDVDVFALHKKPGNDFGAYIRLWKLLRKLKPDVVHTRNLGTIEYSVPVMLAGVNKRVHGEHGRDMSDIDGTNKKYILLRKFYNLFLHRFIALSQDLEKWLLSVVAINPEKVVQLYNGVDLSRFDGCESANSLFSEFNQLSQEDLLIGTVGRLQAEKDQATLIEAFALLLTNSEVQPEKLKLLLIGDGPDRAKLEALVADKNLTKNVVFLGARNDIPALLAQLDVFVLPSRGEGISNTILEAMASSLPVIATNVGGNPELVEENQTGLLVPANNPEKMAEALLNYVSNDALRRAHGESGRKRVEKLFSLSAMVKNYVDVYDGLLSRKP